VDAVILPRSRGTMRRLVERAIRWAERGAAGGEISRLVLAEKVALLAENLIGPFHECHQIGWRHELRVLAFEVVVADRTGP
jgi:hypothetical protein